jgi:hypothetical protein
MRILHSSRLAVPLLLLVLTASPYAKGRTVALVVTGPDLPEPVAVTDPAAVHGHASVYLANFIDRERGPVEDVPSTPVPPYRIMFHVAYGQDDVRMKYVVYFAWDRAERRGRVYFPGRADPWWQHNAFTILLPFEGQWYYAAEGWGQAVYDAISRDTHPRRLEAIGHWRH